MEDLHRQEHPPLSIFPSYPVSTLKLPTEIIFRDDHPFRSSSSAEVVVFRRIKMTAVPTDSWNVLDLCVLDFSHISFLSLSCSYLVPICPYLLKKHKDRITSII